MAAELNAPKMLMPRWNFSYMHAYSALRTHSKQYVAAQQQLHVLCYNAST